MEWNTYELVVHWHEADPAGIAFHGNYLFWVERAFVAFLAAHGYDNEPGQLAQNIGFPVTWMECRYVKPIPVWSKVKVDIAISPESNLKKLITLFRILFSKTEGLAAEGQIHRRFVEMGSFQIVECPQELRSVFGLG